MSKYWTKKHDGVDEIVAEDFNEAFDLIYTDMKRKADTYVTDSLDIRVSLLEEGQPGGGGVDLNEYVTKAELAEADYATKNNVGAAYTSATRYTDNKYLDAIAYVNEQIGQALESDY
jgi:hypothetical protein